MLKTITEETKEPCTLCRGSGTGFREDFTGILHTVQTMVEIPCRKCQGARYVVTKILTTREEVNTDALADAVADRLAQRLKARTFVGTSSFIPFRDGYFK